MKRQISLILRIFKLCKLQAFVVYLRKGTACLPLQPTPGLYHVWPEVQWPLATAATNASAETSDRCDETQYGINMLERDYQASSSSSSKSLLLVVKPQPSTIKE